MTSSNGIIFRATGHLCREFTGNRWIPCTKASDAELCCFLWSAPEWKIDKKSWGWWFETSSRPLWRHSNDVVGTELLLNVSRYSRYIHDVEYFAINSLSTTRNGSPKQVIPSTSYITRICSDSKLATRWNFTQFSWIKSQELTNAPSRRKCIFTIFWRK